MARKGNQSTSPDSTEHHGGSDNGNVLRPPLKTERRSGIRPSMGLRRRQPDTDALRDNLLSDMVTNLQAGMTKSSLREQHREEVKLHLRGGKKGTILYWVAMQLRGDLQSMELEAVLEIADMALELDPDILKTSGTFGAQDTPLHLAAGCESLCPLLDCIYDRLQSKPEEITKAISTPNEYGETVLHIAIMNKRMHPVNSICRLINISEPEAFLLPRKGNNHDGITHGSGNTPFHDAVHVDNINKPMCRKSPICEECATKRYLWLTGRRTILIAIEKLVEKSREVLTQPNESGQTPYLYHQWSKLKQVPEAPNAPTMMQEEIHKGAQGAPALPNGEKTSQSLAKPDGKTKPTTGAPDAHTQEALLASRCEEKRDEAVWPLVERYLYHSSFTLSKVCDVLTCFSRKSDQSGKIWSFQIPGDPLSTEAHDFYEFLDFASTMTELEIQIARPSADGGKPEDRRMALPNNDPKALEQWQHNTESLVQFFDMLRRKEVERIIKLTVWDNEEMPCNDETIANCLHGFDVRYLDWKKWDLSIDVVRLKAPNVVELWLKSMDSPSALRAWAGPGGICCLMQLRKLHVKFEKGREHHDRYISGVHAFLRDLRDNVAIFRASKILESQTEFLDDSIAIEETERILVMRNEQQARKIEQEAKAETMLVSPAQEKLVSGDPPQSRGLERRQSKHGGHEKAMKLSEATCDREYWEKLLGEKDENIETLRECLGVYANKLYLLEREMVRLQRERQKSMASAGCLPMDCGQGRELEKTKKDDDTKQLPEVDPILLATSSTNPHQISATPKIDQLLHLDQPTPQNSNGCEEHRVADANNRTEFIAPTLENLPSLVRVGDDFISSTFLVETTVDPPPEACPSGNDDGSSFASHEMDSPIVKLEDVGNKWMTAVTAFTQAYFTPDMSKDEKRKVKIALLDDGVNVAASTEFKDRINPQGWPNWSAEGPNENFFHSTNGHGTQMATLIISVCPAVRLYVAKLPFAPLRGSKAADLSESKDKRKVAKAAADAIIWATFEQRVDIITMSWTTVLNSVSDSDDIKDLKNAILRATGEGVIMYCSAEDEGGYTKFANGDELWPVSAGVKSLVSIGAADKTGNKLKDVDANSINYLFPGKDIDALTYGSREGSSAATALAAGFAALIIWCFALEKDKRRKPVANANTMAKIFEGLKANSSWGPLVNPLGLFKSDAAGKSIMTPEKVVKECGRWI